VRYTYKRNLIEFLRALATPRGAVAISCLVAAFLLARVALAQAIATHEVLVLASAPTQITRTTTTSVELQNLGPNNIWCGVSADAGVAVVNKSHRVDAISAARGWSTPPTREKSGASRRGPTRSPAAPPS
jgi:hypothetical protein